MQLAPWGSIERPYNLVKLQWFFAQPEPLFSYLQTGSTHFAGVKPVTLFFEDQTMAGLLSEVILY